MARIRTIKPEFPQSESMGRVSRDARLLFIMLWTIADDDGRARANSRMLASLLYPYDEDAPKLLEGWLTELEQENCVRLYTVDGNTYLQIQKWAEHQRVDKPSRSRLPAPPEKFANVREASRGSANIPLGPGPGRDLGKDQEDPPSLRSGGGAQAKPEVEPPVPKPKVVKGTRWPADAEIPDAWLHDAGVARTEFQLDPIDLRYEAARFSNYWASKAGGDACHIDWRKTWMNWATDKTKTSTKRTENGSGKRTALDSHLAGIAMLIDEKSAKRS